MKLLTKTVAIFIICFISSMIFADPANYVSGKASADEAHLYTGAKEISSRYLINRDAKLWLENTHGKLALDYGSGLGYSAEFLEKQGFSVVGVDISPHMIKSANVTYPQISFVLMQDDKLPFADKSFDLVYSCLVLFEIDNLQKMHQYLVDGARVLKDDGYLIAITGSQHLGNRHYKSILNYTDYPENENPTSGSIIKVTLTEINLTFSDYFWTEQDYRKAFADAGLKICAVHYPLGKDNEGYEWHDEKNKSPFIMMLAKKTPLTGKLG